MLLLAVSICCEVKIAVKIDSSTLYMSNRTLEPVLAIRPGSIATDKSAVAGTVPSVLWLFRTSSCCPACLTES